MTRAGGGSFGDLLRRDRRLAGLSQRALAARAGLSTRAVGNLERGARTRPHRGTVDKLVAALGLVGADADALAAAAHCARPAQPVPLVGRAVQRAALAELVHHTDSAMTLLVGPPGIGKTRLLDEAAALAASAGVAVHRHRCGGDRGCWTATPPSHRVLLLDDLHRADRAAWAWLNLLLRGPSVRIVGAARTDPGPLAARHRMRVEVLAPLCERSGRFLLPSTAAPPAVQQALLLARGRPRWLLAFAEGMAAGEPPLGPDGPPVPVVAAVGAVLDELSPSARRSLRVAALATAPWPATILGDDQSAAVGLRLGLLTQARGGLRFTDELVRLVLAAELGPVRRAAVHRMLAGAGVDRDLHLARAGLTRSDVE